MNNARMLSAPLLGRVSLMVACVAVAGCGPISTGATFQPIRIRFPAVVGGKPFACSSQYALGTPATNYRPRDFRVYVHEISLLAQDGRRVPVTLTADGIWQNESIALLDFEDGTADCVNGTVATNSEVVGKVAVGTYRGLSFKLGVPFESNHQDATAALPPLNSTAMFWNWMGGYKFLRIDGITTGLPNGHNIHIGSTGCVAGSAPNSVGTCSAENRVSVDLEPFVASSHRVVFDLERLLDETNLDANDANTPPGCMSAPTDADCAPIFARLGLPLAGVAASHPQVFVWAEEAALP